MEILDTLRTALSDDATPEARAAGLAIVDQLAAEAAPPQPQPAINPASVANIVSAFRGVPPEQLLDLAIAKLRSALPAGAQVPMSSPLKFHIIPVPQTLSRP